jgi:hypothetical protein
MQPPFPPQFFVLLGIDIFLGGSIATVAFDENFPAGLPYILDFGALAGFIQLVIGPSYISGYPPEMQFYYCAAFTVIAVVSVLACNLFVILIRGRKVIGGVLAVGATMPSILATFYFISAYVNGAYVTLPIMPMLPWELVWGAFLGASALIALATVAVYRGKFVR